MILRPTRRSHNLDRQTGNAFAWAPVAQERALPADGLMGLKAVGSTPTGEFSSMERAPTEASAPAASEQTVALRSFNHVTNHEHYIGG
jgi:hypothetical protein